MTPRSPPSTFPPPRRAEDRWSTSSRRGSTPRTRSAASPARGGTSSTSRAPSPRPRSRDASYTPETARARVAVLRARAAGTPLPLSGDDAALVKEWTDVFDAYAAVLRFSPAHHGRTKAWASFTIPKPMKFDALVATEHSRPDLPEARFGLPSHARARDGFTLTDPRKTARQVTGETHYCILCHERDKDSCAKGLRQKDGSIRANPVGVPLAGCPLDEKISEMHLLRREGDSLVGPRAHLHRQSDGPRHRAPHLQRLHEGLHLSDAGSRRHPAGGDGRSHGRPRDALGVRDLVAADALEPAQRGAPVRAPLQRQERSRRGARAGRLHARAPSPERGLRGRRDRRPEDRASPRGAHGHREARAEA